MDLHNSTMYGGKTTETELDRDTFGTVNSWPSENGNEEYFIGVEEGESSFAPGASVCFGQPIVGLKFGMPKDTENLSSTTNSTAPVSLNSMSSNAAKRSRVSYQSMQTSRCLVEGCNLDLTSAKDYHRRHRICESHSKSPRVIIAGVERRFCQQCSRFHNLSEFDDKKRSCRRRLSDHNARRRRPHLETMHSSSVAPSSSLYGRRPPSFLLNRTPSLSSNTCESSSSLKLTQAGNPLIRSSGNAVRKENQWTWIFSALFIALVLESLTNTDASAANSQSPLNEAQNLPRALSLLSTTTWALNEPESTSLEQLMQGSVSTAQPSMPLELQNRPLISAAQVSAEQAHPLSSHLRLQGTDNYHFRDLQSFEPPYEHGFHFSNRIN